MKKASSSSSESSSSDSEDEVPDKGTKRLKIDDSFLFNIGNQLFVL